MVTDEEAVLEVEAVVKLLVGGEEVVMGLVRATVGSWRFVLCWTLDCWQQPSR